MIAGAVVALTSSLWLGCAREAEQPLNAPSLAQALADLTVLDSLDVAIDTAQGSIPCEVFPARTPRAVAMFVGLARGRGAWRDPRTNEVVRRPYYRGLSFFRAIPGALIQAGCPLGNGTGHPGYRIPVESAPGDHERLMQPGALLLARYHPAPNREDPNPPPAGHVIGSQFVIALTDMSHLAGEVTVIGACRSLDVVRRIAGRVAAGERPQLNDVRFPEPVPHGSER